MPVGQHAWFLLQTSIPAQLRQEPRAEEWFRYRDLFAMGQRDLGMEPILERKRALSRCVYFLSVPPLSFLANFLVSSVRGWGGVLSVSVYLSGLCISSGCPRFLFLHIQMSYVRVWGGVCQRVSVGVGG